MADKFVEPIQEGEEHKYEVTAVFSNFIYEKLPQVDGILYQSVQYPENFNVALEKKVIDQKRIYLNDAYRHTYQRTGPITFKEIESVPATSIDMESGNVFWP